MTPACTAGCATLAIALIRLLTGAARRDFPALRNQLSRGACLRFSQRSAIARKGTCSLGDPASALLHFIHVLKLFSLTFKVYPAAYLLSIGERYLRFPLLHTANKRSIKRLTSTLIFHIISINKRNPTLFIFYIMRAKHLARRPKGFLGGAFWRVLRK